MPTLFDEPGKLSILKKLFKYDFQEAYEEHRRSIFWLVFTSAVLLLLAFATYLAFQTSIIEKNTRVDNKHSLMMFNELHNLHSQLQQIAISANYPTNIRNTVSTLANELKTLEKSLADNAKTSDIKKISDQLVTVQNDFTDLDKNIAMQFNSKKYIDVKSLPFKVTHLDMIAGQPFTSIDYDHHITPLGVGDSLNGWALTTADYSGQTVEFVNRQGQYVKINLADETL